jgi:two-component system, chemotaxis family, protein-glutamate methylesterase/glutaminase
MSKSNRIHVLVVDDSAVVRQAMHAVLSQEEDIEVSAASDPLIAMSKMRLSRPDVLLLDLEMPRMDGLTFLRKIMAEDPIPTLICSSVAAQGTDAALRALDLGAVGIVTKPKIGVNGFLHESAVMLIDVVRSAAQARLRSRGLLPVQCKARPNSPRSEVLSRASRTAKIIAVGASTGGTEALSDILAAMPPDAPPIVIVQHMPEYFTRAFANRLNEVCRITVTEARDGDSVNPGRAFIAPGNRHMSVHRMSGGWIIQIKDGALVSRHRPSVDVLFHSVAEACGQHALGVILTGMGNDGAQGLLAMKRAGATTIAQDEATSVVFGMPKQAIAMHAAEFVAPLHGIAGLILDHSDIQDSKNLHCGVNEIQLLDE